MGDSEWGEYTAIDITCVAVWLAVIAALTFLI
jgi:hypothetical protein